VGWMNNWLSNCMILGFRETGFLGGSLIGWRCQKKLAGWIGLGS
jgi:hypothetical protein